MLGGLWDVVFAHSVEPLILHIFAACNVFEGFYGLELPYMHPESFIGKPMLLRSYDLGMIL